MRKAYSVIADFSGEAIRILRENDIELTIRDSNIIPDTKELIDLLQKYDIIILGVKTIVRKDILEYISSPKVIASLSIGLDHIDKEIIDSDLITVLNIKDANTVSVAEHIFSLIFALNKRIIASNDLVLKQMGYRKNLQEIPEDISGKKLGLIGAGNITKEVIKISKVFHMELFCFTRNPSRHSDLLEMGVIFKSLDEILKECDIINVSIPLTDATLHLISKEKIDLMKPTATFINTSRADIVDIHALVEKADNFNTFSVGLDIDLDGYEELFSKFRNNVIVTFHIASMTRQAISRMDTELANNIIKN